MSKFRGAGKWKADGPSRTNTGSSIRGKISAPIIADDEEFPIREPGTGIATPLGKDSMEGQFPQRTSTGSGQILPPNRIGSNGIEHSSRASPPPSQPAYEPPPPPTTQPSGLRNSMMSSSPSANDGKPQRKKSSLGSVFRKLFGGKKRKESSSSSTTAQSSGGFRAGQHRSDPTALTRSPKSTSPSQKRSASLPINEFNRALRSHSIILADDFPLGLEGDANRESMQTDGRTRPRRATTPSRLWTPSKSRGYEDWTGLSPRPASTHGRDSKFISDAEADAAVGIAVTSGSHPNRRSRSLGELRGVGPVNIIVRRRSDEIRYWRESYDPGLLSPMSSNKADAEEPIQLDLAEMQQEAPQEQPQPFNFGPMGEMAGMKITQAASLETRVQKLEDRMLQMGKAVSQMHHRTSRDLVVFRDPPKKSSRRDRSVSTNRPRTENSEIILPTEPRYREPQPPAQPAPHGSQKRSSSYGSRPSTISTQNSNQASFDSFSHYPLLTSDEHTPINTFQPAGRPLSTSTTIRGMPSSSPTTSKDAHLTGEHYTVLTNMLLAEQAARQTLEALVQTLQQQIQDLRSSGTRSFPTPDSDVQADPLKAGGGNEFSSFEQDDTSDEESRYAQDDFQTPSEERGTFSDEIFGRVNGGDVKSPSRTLSLSRMTLGVQPKLNF